MRQEIDESVERPLLDLQRPNPRVRRLMRGAALVGMLAIAVGTWQVAGSLVSADLLDAEFVQGLKAAARWLVGGMLLVAIGVWDR